MLDGPQIMKLVFRRWWLVVVLALAGGVAGYAYSKSATSHYSASEGLLVTGQAPNPLLVNLTSSSQDPSRVVQTQVDVLESQAVKAMARQTLGGVTPNVSVTSSTASNLITVTGNAPTQAGASRSLHAVVGAYNTLALQVQRGQIGGARSVLVEKLTQARNAKGALKNHPNNDQLTTRSQQLPQLQTLLDQLDASLKLGVTGAQPIGVAQVSGPIVRPDKSQAIAIGAVTGIVLAVMMALALGRSTEERRRVFAAAQSSRT